MIERRTVSVEMRAAEGRTISGYAAVFNQLSANLRWFREKIAPGAFAESLASGANIFAFWNHNSDLPLGSTRAKTLNLFEDERGLGFDLTLGQNQWDTFAHERVSDGTVQEMSFSFETKDASWEIVDGQEIRTLHKVDLFEISPVMFPAYRQTSVEARAVEEIWQKHLAESGAAGTREEPGLDVSLALAINNARQRRIRA